MTWRISRSHVIALLVPAALALLAYLPSLSLPFISDDYIQISLARHYGPVSGWKELASDALYRCRATSLILTWWTERLFGLHPLPYTISSLVLHIFNTWLVLALGAWNRIGWRVSFLAAAFFAVYEGHQEAVIWYAAIPELLVFFFSLAALLWWIGWLDSGGKRPRYYAAALACFVLALFSKESAVAVVGLMLLPVALQPGNRPRRLLQIVPFALLSLVYVFLIFFTAPSDYLHLHDGTFSLKAPFWRTLVFSSGRLLWFWGFLSLAALAVLWKKVDRSLLAVALAWIVITFLPYCFLTYMSRVPSRHTYFASAGLALIVGYAFWILRERLGATRGWITVALAALIVAHNCGYLWLRKRAQYVERAAPTEQLINFARQTDGPVYLHCFPYSRYVAEAAVELATGKPPAMVRFLPPGTPPTPGALCFGHTK